MRTSKRILALLLVLVLVVGLIPAAGARLAEMPDANDVTPAYARATSVLFQEGILVGTTTEGFVPAGNFTRAQMATVLYRLATGNETMPAADEALFAGVAIERFSDVSAGWAASFIGWAYLEGVVVGVDANRFAPNSNVTGTQLAAMLLRLIGYDQRGEFAANWPAAANQLAMANGLFQDVQTAHLGTGNAAIRRDVAAQIVFNALFAQHVRLDLTIQLQYMNRTMAVASFTTHAAAIHCECEYGQVPMTFATQMGFCRPSVTTPAARNLLVVDENLQPLAATAGTTTVHVAGFEEIYETPVVGPTQGDLNAGTALTLPATSVEIGRVVDVFVSRNAIYQAAPVDRLVTVAGTAANAVANPAGLNQARRTALGLTESNYVLRGGNTAGRELHLFVDNAQDGTIELNHNALITGTPSNDELAMLNHLTTRYSIIGTGAQERIVSASVTTREIVDIAQNPATGMIQFAPLGVAVVAPEVWPTARIINNAGIDLTAANLNTFVQREVLYRNGQMFYVITPVRTVTSAIHSVEGFAAAANFRLSAGGALLTYAPAQPLNWNESENLEAVNHVIAGQNLFLAFLELTAAERAATGAQWTLYFCPVNPHVVVAARPAAAQVNVGFALLTDIRLHDTAAHDYFTAVSATGAWSSTAELRFLENFGQMPTQAAIDARQYVFIVQVGNIHFVAPVPAGDTVTIDGLTLNAVADLPEITSTNVQGTGVDFGVLPRWNLTAQTRWIFADTALDIPSSDYLATPTRHGAVAANTPGRVLVDADRNVVAVFVHAEWSNADS